MIKDLVVLIKLFLLIGCACFMFGFLFGVYTFSTMEGWAEHYRKTCQI